MKLTCLVDNAVRQSSRFWGEHGISFLIETPNGRVLFDTGSSGAVLIHNLALTGVQTAGLSALVLSHSHPDHTGGLSDLFDRRTGLPLYANPALLRSRFVQLDGQTTALGLAVSPETLAGSVTLHLSETQQQVLPGVWTTGVITERPEPEGRGTGHVIRQGETWVPDPYDDDLSLWVETPGGHALILGCCHAGLLNTLAHVRRLFGVYPNVVVGGTHLVSSDAAQLAHLVQVLRPLGPPMLYLNHCTGQPAYVALATAFGDRVRAFPAGSILEL